MNSFINLIVEKYKIILFVIVIITIPLLYFFSQQKFFNHVDIFFEKDDPDILFYKRFQKIYGNEELAIILFKERDIFTVRNIEIIRRMTAAIERTKGVSRVFSLTTAEEAIGTEDTVTFQKIIPEGSLNRRTLSASKQRVLSHATFVKSLISEDGTTTAILIELNPIRDNEIKKELLLSIRNSCKGIASDRITLHFAGVPYVEMEMNSLTRIDFITFTPIIFVIILLIVMFMLRDLPLTVLCQCNLIMCLVWGGGIFSICGEKLNMVTVIIGAVLLAIAVADSIHLLAHYQMIYRYRNGNHREAVREATQSVWLPCLFTSLTTGVGFFSFITSSVRPVKILGIFTACGVLFAFALTVSFLPAVLMMIKRGSGVKGASSFDKLNTDCRTHEASSSFTRIMEEIGKFATASSKSIFLLFLAIMIVMAVGVFQITFETNTMNYLPPESTLKRDIQFIENNFGGTIPFVLLIRAQSKENDFTHCESLQLIDDIQSDLMNAIPQFSTSFSLADYFKEINKAFNSDRKEYYRIPKKRSDILDYYEIGDPEILERILSPDKMETRLSFQSHWDSNERAKRTEAYIKEYMKQKLGEEYTYKFTGLSSLYIHMEFNLKESQLRSFLFAFAIIFIMMFFVCKDVKLTILSMIPNLFPIVITLGIMGWFQIPLDVSTIMIASITIGIAVDDTIHFIIWYKRNVLSGLSIQEALIKTYRDVGKPITITSVVLFCGFFVLILGSIKPTQAFGMLTALSMLFAVIGDLFILPAMIMIFKPRIRRM
jgi:predicted RND superfamily exporter protein